LFDFDFTLIWSILVSELVREVDRDDEVDSEIIGVNWEGIVEWSDKCGLFNDEESNKVEDELSPSRFDRVEDIFWRIGSDGISIWGSSFILTWLDCSLNEFSDVNKAKIDSIR
jgi:hypothetical protein